MKSTFQLNNTQKKLLVAKEHASFIRHCERFGWNPDQVEIESIENFRRRDKAIIEGIRVRARKGGELEFFESSDLFNTNDYWQYLRIQANLKRRMVSDWICKAAPSLQIDYSYVSKIAKLMNLEEVSRDESGSLRSFLLNIPLSNIIQQTIQLTEILTATSSTRMSSTKPNTINLSKHFITLIFN